MTAAELETLSGSEVIARLVNRGRTLPQARTLVYWRDRGNGTAIAEILAILDA